jgi:hypothetical protein
MVVRLGGISYDMRVDDVCSSPEKKPVPVYSGCVEISDDVLGTGIIKERRDDAVVMWYPDGVISVRVWSCRGEAKLRAGDGCMNMLIAGAYHVVGITRCWA